MLTQRIAVLNQLIRPYGSQYEITYYWAHAHYNGHNIRSLEVSPTEEYLCVNTTRGVMLIKVADAQRIDIEDDGQISIGTIAGSMMVELTPTTSDIGFRNTVALVTRMLQEGLN